MRLCLICLLFVIPAGCGGSKSKEGVELSIDNPDQAKTAEGPESAEKPQNEASRQMLILAAKYAKAGMVGKAVETLSRAISQTPDNPELYIARAEVYGMMREDANALADYSTAIRVSPNDATIHNRRGFFLLSRRDHQQAVRDFSEAIRLNADSPQAFNNRGLVYLALKDSEKAIADFSEAVRLDPKYADGFNNRGFAQYRRERYAEALVDLTEAIRLRDSYVNALNNRALVHVALKKFEAAVRDFSAALRNDPYSLKLLQGRRAALQQLERFEEAQADGSRIQWLYGLAEISKKIEQEPLNGQHHIDRGDYLMRGDEFAAAVRDFSRAAQLVRDSPEPLLRRAVGYIALKKLDEAIRDCQTVLGAQELAEAYSIRGDAWLAKGSLDKAIADFERAGRFDSSLVDAYEKRAQLRENAGDREAAAADRSSAAKVEAALK